MRTRHRPSAVMGIGSEAGFSLVEGLIAAALLLVIAVSVLPLFYRALESNLFGSRRSQLSTFASGDIETQNQEPVDQAAWSISAATDGVLSLTSRFWDDGPTAIPDTLGDGQWVDAEADAVGLILWRRDAEIRKYALSDVQILVGAGGGVTTGGGGNPMLFDNPLTDDDGAHFTELRVTIKEKRDTLPAATGRRITIGQFRAF